MSETSKRILSAIIGLPAYVFMFTTDSLMYIPILAASTIISLVCLYEFYQICDRGEGRRPFFVAGMVLGGLVNILMYLFAFGKVFGYASLVPPFDARFLLALIVAVMTILFAVQIFQRPIEGGIYSMAVTIFGVVFIVFSFSHIILMKALKDGFYYIFILSLVVMINDSGAYFGGVTFGKHKANLKVSPNKSWEGYFSGLLASILGMMVTSLIFESFCGKNLFTMVEAALLGIGLSVIGNIGDLIESAIKRDGAIKDSGSLIPGHGGIWDVFDSLIVTMPFFYYYLVLKGVQ